MSKKPYVVQEDSPNLVIVPIDTCYEPSLKKQKLDSDVSQMLPTPKNDNNAFAKKSGAKMNFGGTSRNNDVLIDVSKVKRSPSSWASNFLQSIGGSTTKFSRLYSPVPKSLTPRKENTEPEINEGITSLNTTINTYQAKTNTLITQPVMEKKTSLSKTNINPIQPKCNKPALQSIITKAASQLNNNMNSIKNNQFESVTSTSLAQKCKKLSLPKNYKIPMQSQYNKTTIQPITDKETNQIDSIKKAYELNSNTSKIQSRISVPKTDDQTIPPKYDKPVVKDIIMCKETTQTKTNKDPNQLKYDPKINQPESSIERYQEKSNKNTNRIKYDKEVNQSKTIRLVAQSQNNKHTHRSKFDENIIKSNTNKSKTQPKRNQETNEAKNVEEIKHRKIIKETALPKSYRDPCPSKYDQIISCSKTNKEIPRSKSIKDSNKIKDKKETTYSTKLKTKKDFIHEKYKKVSKTTKYSKQSQEILPKKLKEQAKTTKECILPGTSKTVQINPIKSPQNVLKKQGIILKLNHKIAASDNTKETESLVKEKNTGSESQANIIKKEMSRSFTDERISKSISPIKSVVTKIKSSSTCHNSEKCYQKGSDYHSHFEKPSDLDYHSHKSENYTDSNIDLRTKLKRKIENDYNKDDNKWEHGNKKNKFMTVRNGERFVPDENLIISFNTKDDEEENATPKMTPVKKYEEEKATQKKSPVKKITRKQPVGGKKCKKIKLEINIVFDHADTSDEESMNSEDEANEEIFETMDLSFLDDFNVDEIVESLNECKGTDVQNTKKRGEEGLNSNKEANLTADYGKTQSAPSSNNTNVETKANVQDCEFKDKNETKAENIFCNKVLSGSYQEMELDPTVDENRPHHEIINRKNYLDIDTEIKVEKAADINCLAEIENVIVKEEVNINQTIENDEITALSQKDKSINIKICSASSEITKFQSSSDHKNTELIDCHQFNEINKISVPDNDLARRAVKPLITSSHNNTEVVKNEHTDNDSQLITKIHPKQVHTIIETNIIDNLEIIKTETVTMTTHKANETSINIIVQPDVIIIDDSDTENETEIKSSQTSKDKRMKVLKCDKKKPVDKKSDEVIISTNLTATETAESILILDTDIGIDEKSSDNTNDRSNIIDRKTNSENMILPECEVNTKDDSVMNDKTKLKDTSFELTKQSSDEIPAGIEKTSISNRTETSTEKTSNETKAETSETKTVFKKTEVKHCKDLFNVVKVSDTIASKTTQEIAHMTSAQTDIVVPKKDTAKTVTTNTGAKNTKLEAKVQNKENSQVNSENKDNNSNSKPKLEVARSIANDIFVRKLESAVSSYMDGKYTITDLVSKGKFSKIYNCKDPFNSDYTVKVLKKEVGGYPRGLQNYNMMMKLQNGVPEDNLNCVRLLKGFPLCGFWCFIMEYFPRNLQEVLNENKRSFHIDVVQRLSRQLVSAVTILRNNNIIHSDIKPTHILMNASKTRLKLCGFDQASYFDGKRMLPNTGTVNYRAPELILGYPAGYGIDVWSTALVMFEMATNRKLFPGQYNNDILYKQLCTLGSIPLDMLMQSGYMNAHFRGTSFIRIVGPGGQKVILDNIKTNEKLNNLLFQIYTAEWGRRFDQGTVRNDKAKLCTFSKLLHNMLVMHPKYRIAIEFVFANPFIFETFDS